MNGNVHRCRSRYVVSCVLALIVVSAGNALAAELPGAEVRVSVATELKRLLEQEDTNGDRRITVEDHGPNRFGLRSVSGAEYLVEGTYPLTILLQELALARSAGEERTSVAAAVLYSPPPWHLSRMIRHHYWDRLTRTLDREGLREILRDPKVDTQEPLRLFVPHEDRAALRYYRRIAAELSEADVRVRRLPERTTPRYVKRLNDTPGLLSLALERTPSGGLRAQPFVVPGGRFNEMYGWDSYFIALGLLADGRVALAQSMVEHFVYEIEHYGRILNANRTYYLTRSQPPFLTSMALAVHEHLPRKPENRRWLRRAIRAAIQEYREVWTRGRHLTPTGLSRYYGHGIGIPPETEPAHFDAVLRPWARAYDLSVQEFERRYQTGLIDIPELDAFFRHDRAMRESGHDTTYRLVARAAHLNTVALNSLLYKYETDLCRTIGEEFGGQLKMGDGSIETPAPWSKRARRRRRLVDAYLWNESAGL